MRYKVLIYNKEIRIWVTVSIFDNKEEAEREVTNYRSKGLITMIEYE